MNKNIIILYSNSFPISGSATNRVIHICKALIQEGNIIKLYITRPTEKKNNVRTTRKGVYEGIEFSYVNKNIIWPKELILKGIFQLFGIIKTSIILIKEDYDIALSYADYSFVNNFIYFLFIKFRGKKIVYAVDEYPWSLIYNKNSIFNKLYLKFFYKLFDALIVMTYNLMDYYSTKKRKNAIMHHLPMTVEIERFNKQVNYIDGNPLYIAYCGFDIKNIGGDKYSRDGVDILIDAFSIVCPKYPNLLLYIIGESNEFRVKQVQKLNLKDKVIFIGRIPRGEIPRYLCNAKLLVLARPNSILAQGGFPTKLGEYLATGNPVVVTKVGEIPYYLKDNWNAFLAEPGDIKSFAERMDFALSNPDIAKKIGERGRNLAEDEFNYKKQSIKLQKFLYRV
jgi:glycosyltransferase involved in cell wall biosynthesis